MPLPPRKDTHGAVFGCFLARLYWTEMGFIHGTQHPTQVCPRGADGPQLLKPELESKAANQPRPRASERESNGDTPSRLWNGVEREKWDGWRRRRRRRRRRANANQFGFLPAIQSQRDVKRREEAERGGDDVRFWRTVRHCFGSAVGSRLEASKGLGKRPGTRLLELVSGARGVQVAETRQPRLGLTN